MSIVITALFFIFMLWHDICAAVSMWRDPVGHTSVNFIVWRHSFHSITILTISAIFLVLYFYSFPDKELIHRFFYSIALSTFTVFFYEFWWHLGCWLSIGHANPLFWGMYVSTVGICILYLHKTRGLLEFSMLRSGIFIVGMVYFLLGWWIVNSTGFHEEYLAFCLGQGPDPHTLLIMYNKVLGMTMWMCFFRCGKATLPDGQIELHRKKTERWFPPQKWWHTHKVSEVMRHVPDGAGTVLDLGCGCGDMLAPLRVRGKTIIAVDNDPDVIDYLKREKDLNNIQLILADATSTKLPNGSMDTVLALDVLEHLNGPEDCIEEINRVLKPGGTLIITTPHNTLLWRIIWDIWTIVMPYGEHRTFRRSQLLHLLRRSGIYSCDIYTTHFGCLLMLVGKKGGGTT